MRRIGGGVVRLTWRLFYETGRHKQREWRWARPFFLLIWLFYVTSSKIQKDKTSNRCFRRRRLPLLLILILPCLLCRHLDECWRLKPCAYMYNVPVSFLAYFITTRLRGFAAMPIPLYLIKEYHINKRDVSIFYSYLRVIRTRNSTPKRNRFTSVKSVQIIFIFVVRFYVGISTIYQHLEISDALGLCAQCIFY